MSSRATRTRVADRLQVVLVRFWGKTRRGYVVRDYPAVGYRVLGIVFRDADMPKGLRDPRVNWYRDDEVVLWTDHRTTDELGEPIL